jgi:hypothetical protein
MRVARRAGLSVAVAVFASLRRERGRQRAVLRGKRQRKVVKMLIDLARRAGNALVIERIEATVDFAGGAAEEGALASFQLNDRTATGRIIRVFESSEHAERVVEIELIDAAAHDLEAEITRANLPPRNDARIKR